MSKTKGGGMRVGEGTVRDVSSKSDYLVSLWKDAVSHTNEVI